MYMCGYISMVVTENNFLMTQIHVLCLSGKRYIFYFNLFVDVNIYCAFRGESITQLCACIYVVRPRVVVMHLKKYALFFL